MGLPKVLLITKDIRTYRVFYEQLMDYFRGKIEIVTEENYKEEEIAVALTSSLQLLKGLRIPEDRVLVARRTINTEKLAEIISLPPGTKCLVVNNLREKSQEVCHLLKELGFSLELVPYYPGCRKSVRGIHTAIVPSFTELVPPEIDEVIDIGIRPIDHSTIIELAIRLALPLEDPKLHSARYIKEIVGLTLKLADTINKMGELNQRLELKKPLSTKGFSSRYTLEDIVGNSTSLKETMKLVHKLAYTDKAILLMGENGTGKELFAHSIHNLSSRKNGPFLPINFAGLPESLAESELFGYEEGAFTGAKRGGRMGYFELAHNGTIFLDEIGDAPPSIQALLLRVLQEKQIMRVGGHDMRPVNVRIIAATNKDLKNLVEQGMFRQDLYYRLSVLPLYIPALKERRQDIPLLVDFFAQKYGSRKYKFSAKVLDSFMDYSWPGNVRELEGVIQYIIAVCDGTVVTLEDLPPQFNEENRGFSQEALVDYLSQRGELLHFYTILKALKKAKEKSQVIGRGAIIAYCQDQNLYLSDYKARERMGTLNHLGLINSGTRGQGSKITPKGLAALEFLTKEIAKY